MLGDFCGSALPQLPLEECGTFTLETNDIQVLKHGEHSPQALAFSSFSMLLTRSTPKAGGFIYGQMATKQIQEFLSPALVQPKQLEMHRLAKCVKPNDRLLLQIVDDLFAFVIKMPTLHRLSVFRDDLVFLVYVYQRWAYKVDKRRANEFG